MSKSPRKHIDFTPNHIHLDIFLQTTTARLASKHGRSNFGGNRQAPKPESPAAMRLAAGASIPVGGTNERFAIGGKFPVTVTLAGGAVRLAAVIDAGIPNDPFDRKQPAIIFRTNGRLTFPDDAP